jgi:hypothetical protein
MLLRSTTLDNISMMLLVIHSGLSTSLFCSRWRPPVDDAASFARPGRCRMSLWGALGLAC